MLLLNHTGFALIAATLILFVILSTYYWVIYARPTRAYKQISTNQSDSGMAPISIIIYAKNESDNLKKHLPIILNQNYPEYQVIVINDGSTDDTENTLKSFQNNYKHLYHTYIPSNTKYLSRKKLALTLGAKAAKHDILLFTEANCQPISDKWLSSIAFGYETNTSIVLGYCKYGNYKGLLQKLIAYDNLLNGLRSLSFAISGNPYTGNGRNLSYKKELFFKHKGYYKHLNLHAGDDDLFINEAANRDNTNTIFTPDSITEMDKTTRFADWKEMKLTKATTQCYYKGLTNKLYQIETLCFFMFQITSIITIATTLPSSWLISIIATLLYIIRFSMKAKIIHKSATMLQQTPNLRWLFLLEFIQPIFDTYIKFYHILHNRKDYTFSLES